MLRDRYSTNAKPVDLDQGGGEMLAKMKKSKERHEEPWDRTAGCRLEPLRRFLCFLGEEVKCYGIPLWAPLVSRFLGEHP
jgi:hypothetical protein